VKYGVAGLAAREQGLGGEQIDGDLPEVSAEGGMMERGVAGIVFYHDGLGGDDPGWKLGQESGPGRGVEWRVACRIGRKKNFRREYSTRQIGERTRSQGSLQVRRIHRCHHN
jgi:hypothetical protein